MPSMWISPKVKFLGDKNRPNNSIPRSAQSTVANVKPSITCKKCGGFANYDFDRGVYRCKPCSEPKIVSEGPATPVSSDLTSVIEVGLDELELALKAPQAGPQTSKDVSLQSCKGCGAQVEIPTALAIGECLFCGRKTTSGQPQPSLHHTSQCIIPFSIDQESAIYAIKQHLKTLWLRPGGLSNKLNPITVRKLFVPFWAFDAQVTSNWQGTTSAVEQPGLFGRFFGAEERHVTRPISGQRNNVYDDWLVCASHGVEESVLRQIEPFDTEKAHLKDPVLDSGVPLEVAPIGPRHAWTLAQVQIRKKEYREALQEAQSGDQRKGVSLTGRVKFGVPKGKSAVLPLYVFSQPTLWGHAQIIVNGETGKVGAHIPYSLFKLIPTLAICAGFLLLVALVSAGSALPFYILIAIIAAVIHYGKRQAEERTFLENT
jgi:ribosomal protein L37AE/L43A